MSQGDREPEHAVLHVSGVTRIETKYCNSSNENSRKSSSNTLGVRALSPGHIYPASDERTYCESLLPTHYNKRKYNNLHELDVNDLSGQSSLEDLDTLERQATNKKPKYSETGASTSSSFGNQANGTALSTKLKSVTSASSSSVSCASECIRLPGPFPHPIIHPPTELPQEVASQRDVAERRIEAILKRERSYRVQDGLPSSSLDSATVAYGNDMFGMEADFRREVVQWIFNVKFLLY